MVSILNRRLAGDWIFKMLFQYCLRLVNCQIPKNVTNQLSTGQSSTGLLSACQLYYFSTIKHCSNFRIYTVILKMWMHLKLLNWFALAIKTCKSLLVHVEYNNGYTFLKFFLNKSCIIVSYFLLFTCVESSIYTNDRNVGLPHNGNDLLGNRI